MRKIANEMRDRKPIESFTESFLVGWMGGSDKCFFFWPFSSTPFVMLIQLGKVCLVGTYREHQQTRELFRSFLISKDVILGDNL